MVAIAPAQDGKKQKGSGKSAKTDRDQRTNLGKAKKKTWAKGKVQDKLNNLVLFDKATVTNLAGKLPTTSCAPAAVSETEAPLLGRGSLQGSLVQASLN